MVLSPSGRPACDSLLLCQNDLFISVSMPSHRCSMIKSELVQRIADRNPHLYLRDVEKIVNAILDEITRSACRRQSRRIAWLSARSRSRQRDARQARNPRTGAQVDVGQQGGAVLQDRKRHAGAAERWCEALTADDFMVDPGRGLTACPRRPDSVGLAFVAAETMMDAELLKARLRHDDHDAFHKTFGDRSPRRSIALAFAIANRAMTIVSFDPFSPRGDTASPTISAPLFVVLLLDVDASVSSSAVRQTSLTQGRDRQRARHRHSAEAERLRTEAERLRAESDRLRSQLAAR